MTMKKLVCLILHLLLVAVLVSCARATPTSEVVEGKLNPGDKIGSMTVQEHASLQFTPDLSKYCAEYFVDESEAVTSIVDCELPSLSRLRFVVGWGAKDETTLDSNWSAMTWALDIDDHPINLDQFAQSKMSGGGLIGRWWIIDLVDLSPGKHTIRAVWTSEIPIDDGVKVYAPGVHEHIINLTVAEK
jgi:hypothetical protein